jgi:hypothetical protein
MNDKIKELLENAEQSDAIAKNKWRIENREQLRKERKKKLKELMEKDKQQTAVEWLWEIAYNRELTVEDWKQAKEIEKDQHIKSWETGLMKVDFNEYYNETYGGGKQ